MLKISQSHFPSPCISISMHTHMHVLVTSTVCFLAAAEHQAIPDTSNPADYIVYIYSIYASPDLDRPLTALPQALSNVMPIH